jgi:hypothetical protein
MTIYINDTILAGNMGDGWNDQNAAADAYADFLTDAYRAAAHRRFPDQTIEVDVTVQYNTEGWRANVSVMSDDDAAETGEFERDLTDGEYWSQWCESEDAVQYAQ